MDHGAYPGGWADIASDVKRDVDTAIALAVDLDGGAYCLVATRVADAPCGSGAWSYDSDRGGLLADHAECS